MCLIICTVFTWYVIDVFLGILRATLISSDRNASVGVSGTNVSGRYSDLGGISGVLQEVRELIEYPLIHPEVYQHLGIEPVSHKYSAPTKTHPNNRRMNACGKETFRSQLPHGGRGDGSHDPWRFAFW